VSLAVGDKLGPYEILGPIGAGGMGKVYRAHDSRLNRDVAIKVANADFSERFTHEARAIGALNHTNICHLYDVGPNYLVMEYVEGQDLRGPLGLDDALPIIQQLIDGIEAAHEKNIIHRDLKPANIKITPEGVVKILDFGLAKAMESPPSEDGKPENSPTSTIGATRVGAILGTAAYMAPEQAKGKAADRRSDIWSFGVILYEVLTGQQLFSGETVVEILGAVLNRNPDISAAPRRIHGLLRWCLERERKQRLASISDARMLLCGAHADESATQSTAQPSAAFRLRSWLPWCIAAILLLALTPANVLYFRKTPPPGPTLRYTIAAPDNGTIHSFALSPDGRTLVVAAAVNGKRQLWLRSMDALQAQPMPSTEEAMYPFWSPDSRSIGFFAQGKLKKIAASGGPAQSLCDASNGRGGSWNRDDVIVFSPGLSGSSIRRVAAAGGVPVDVIKTQGVHWNPVFLPDGLHFLHVVRAGSAETNGIYVSSLDGKENRRVLNDVSSMVFAPAARSGLAGHILFVRENTLMAQPFDAATAQVSGDVFPVAAGVSLTNTVDLPATVSVNGLLLYQPGGARAAQMGWYDRTGKSLGPVGAPGRVFEPAISPDEKSVVFRVGSATGYDLWVHDLRRGIETRFTSDLSINIAPFWSPQGDRIVFASNRKGGVYNIYQRAVGGSGQDEMLLSNVRGVPTQWSRDGRFIVYFEVDPKTKYDIGVIPALGSAADRKAIPFLRTEFNELMGQLSPDSRWMAFTSDRSGRREVYVRPFPAADGEWAISVAGGEQPRWRGDGKELFFIAADGKMMSASAKPLGGAKPSFDTATPVSLFDSHIALSPNNDLIDYDVTADGKRFFISTTGGISPPLTVVKNWNASGKK
jgi:eukaryotic-like serine/threonine-protein kinase